MSYKTILVHGEPDRACDPALDLAIDVADMFGAAILGVGAEAFEPGAAYGYMAGELLAAVCDQVDVDLDLAETHFRDRTARCSTGVDWVSSRGYPVDIMARHACGADLVVARRPQVHAQPTQACHPTDLLMCAGLPLLLAAEGGARLQAKRVVVAWRPGREANRAISDALPFLMRAEEVHVVHVCAAGMDDGKVGLDEVRRRLARHGVAVECETATPAYRSITGDLHAAADRHGADLIVAGGYGHSRMREWALGGVTQELVDFSNKFVLLSR
jgi:nucleotide-binding universal stress UspA family protein